MAFGVTVDGFVLKDLATIRQEIEDEQRETIDAGLDLSDQTPLGQINAIMAAQFAEIWEGMEAVYGSQYPDSASAASLDNVSSITGTTRSPSTKTQVTAQVTLNPNKALPAGSVANLSGQPSARFVSQATVPADPAGGTFDVLFEAESAGFVQVLPGQLSEITEAVSGWVGVGNTAPATFTGSNTESDLELRVKRMLELTAGGSTSVDAIRADLVQLNGVTDAVVTENLITHTIACVTRGGAGTEVAQQIFDSKAAGIGTTGALSEVVLDSQGVSHTIFYAFATELVFHAALTLNIDPLVFDSVGGPAAVEQAVADYVNTLGIGSDVIYDQVKCAAFSVPGVTRIQAALIGFGAPTGTVDLPVATTQYASADVLNVGATVA